MDQLLVRVEEAAIALGLGRSQVYRMVAEGTLPAVRLGRSVRIPERDLRQWVVDRICPGKAVVADAVDAKEGDPGATA